MEMIEKIEEKIKLLSPDLIDKLDEYINKLLEENIIETHFASQEVLSKDWSTEIEDEIWKHL